MSRAGSTLVKVSPPSSSHRMADCSNWHQQVEEAVALQAILGDDFRLLEVGGLPSDVNELYQRADELHSQGLSHSHLSFQAFVRLAVPDKGLSIQVENNNATRRTVHHLPPVRLNLLLPGEYPSSMPPEVSVTASWLSAEQISCLEEELRAQAIAEQGSPVCYTLASCLEGALEHLQIQDTLVIPFDRKNSEAKERQASSSYASTSEVTAEAFLDCSSTGHKPSSQQRPEDEFDILVHYNACRELQLFQEGTWTCMICFEEVPGTQCIYAAACRHFFCRSCLQMHCKTKLSEKRIDMLTCPDPQCKEAIHRERVSALLTPEEIQRWEDTELQTALLKMKDVVFCPRCNAPTIEDSDNAAMCSRCHFAFCSLCQGGYHPGQRCMSVEMKLEMLKQRLEGRKDGELLRELKRKQEELLSVASIQKTSKSCPTCSAAISKTEGCNKMVCVQCGTYFCWVCGQRISGYDHFKAEECALFDEEEVRRWNQQFGPIQRPDLIPAEVGGAEEGRHVFRAKPCAQCGQLNVKRGNLNLMTCWACTCRYCYLCGKILRKGEGATHFKPTSCRQHSAD